MVEMLCCVEIRFVWKYCVGRVHDQSLIGGVSDTQSVSLTVSLDLAEESCRRFCVSLIGNVCR